MGMEYAATGPRGGWGASARTPYLPLVKISPTQHSLFRTSCYLAGGNPHPGPYPQNLWIGRCYESCPGSTLPLTTQLVPDRQPRPGYATREPYNSPY
jgi:hypothetical protein